MSRLNTVLLDVDGTLIDTIDLGVRTLREALQELVGASPPDSELRSAMSLPTREAVRRFCPPGQDQERLAALWAEAFHNGYNDSYAYPGVEEGLAAIRAAGFRVGAVTAQTRVELDRTLAVFALGPLLDVTVAVDEVARAKPAPDSIHRALALLRSAPGSTVYLGDSPADIQAARRAGVAAAAALWGGQLAQVLLAERPDYSFATFTSFAAWLKAWEAYT